MRTILIMSAAAIALASPAAFAQQTGDAKRGLELAQQWCAECHVVRPGEGRSASDAVPTFPSIAAKLSTTRTSLLVFLQTPHQQMPDFALSRKDMSDLADYILLLRSR